MSSVEVQRQEFNLVRHNMWRDPVSISICFFTMQLVCCYSAYNQSDVSKLCSGLPGDEEVADLFISMVRWIPLSTALLFLLGEGGGLELRFVGASSSASVSSIRGMWGSESSILNSGWVIKLWIELLDSGFSNPSYKELRNAFTTRICEHQKTQKDVSTLLSSTKEGFIYEFESTNS